MSPGPHIYEPKDTLSENARRMTEIMRTIKRRGSTGEEETLDAGRGFAPPEGGWPEAENLKETNPKEFFGNKKVPLELFPDSALAAGAMAMLEGALKYGRYNYRISGIRASVYVAATRRHLAAYWNGRDIDEKSGLPHLWKALACLAVVIDAQAAGQFLDDRPPAVDMDAMMDELEGEVARLKEELGHHTPRQYTIADSGSTPPRPSE